MQKRIGTLFFLISIIIITTFPFSNVLGKNEFVVNENMPYDALIYKIVSSNGKAIAYVKFDDLKWISGSNPYINASLWMWSKIGANVYGWKLFDNDLCNGINEDAGYTLFSSDAVLCENVSGKYIAYNSSMTFPYVPIIFDSNSYEDLNSTFIFNLYNEISFSNFPNSTISENSVLITYDQPDELYISYYAVLDGNLLTEINYTYNNILSGIYKQTHLVFIGDVDDFNTYLENVVNIRWGYKIGDTIIYSYTCDEITRYFKYTIVTIANSYYTWDANDYYDLKCDYPSIAIRSQKVYAIIKEWDADRWVDNQDDGLFMEYDANIALIGVGNKEGIFLIDNQYPSIITPIGGVYYGYKVVDQYNMLDKVYSIFNHMGENLLNITYNTSTYYDNALIIQDFIDFNRDGCYVNATVNSRIGVITSYDTKIWDVLSGFPSIEYKIRKIGLQELPNYDMPSSFNIRVDNVFGNNLQKIIYIPKDDTQDIKEYTITFGDGDILVLSEEEAGSFILHTYSFYGNYIVRIVVTYTSGEQVMGVVMVRVTRSLSIWGIISLSVFFGFFGVSFILHVMQQRKVVPKAL